PAAEILPESETGFFFKDAPVGTTIIFIKDGQGKVTHYLKKQGGQELRTDKISNQVPAEVISSNKLRPFDKQEAMIPVRDGVKLHTVIFIPKDAREPLPILIQRTPYGADLPVQALNFSQRELVEDGYIFVFQDIRGRFKSEGQFIMFRPPRDRRDPKAVDESTDTYDTIEWLVKNVPNNN